MALTRVYSSIITFLKLNHFWKHDFIYIYRNENIVFSLILWHIFVLEEEKIQNSINGKKLYFEVDFNFIHYS